MSWTEIRTPPKDRAELPPRRPAIKALASKADLELTKVTGPHGRGFELEPNG
ncbi:MAG: hypothetical protein AAF725_05490 [Acidobacteriota bacterium]